MSLWWLQPGWTDACCSVCGAKIYPEGDPDWGKCFTCFTADLDAQRAEAEHYKELEAEYWREMERIEGKPPA